MGCGCKERREKMREALKATRDKLAEQLGRRNQPQQRTRPKQHRLS